VLRTQHVSRNKAFRHSRAGGNPACYSWIPGRGLRPCPEWRASRFRHSSESWNPGGMVWVGHFVSEQRSQAIFARKRDCFVAGACPERSVAKSKGLLAMTLCSHLSDTF